MKLARGDTTYVLDVENISESGACVRWHEPKAPSWLENGRRLTMDLSGADVPGTLTLAGQIVHVGMGPPVQFGVLFDATLPEGSRERLDELIRLAADPSRPPPLRRT